MTKELAKTGRGLKQLILRLVLGLATVVLVAYFAVLLVISVRQRQMIYLPSEEHGPAASYGLAGTTDMTLTTLDGKTIAAWYRPPAAGKCLFVVYHGNGGALSTLSGMLQRLSSDGSGFLAIDYRGYGGSPGQPTEDGLLYDGEAAYAQARELGYEPGRIVILGESLGSNIAIAVAAAHPSKALVLDSSFSSAVDLAAAKWWMFPVRRLMLDTFDSFDRIDQVGVPKLFIHGSADSAIAFSFAKKLFDHANAPKTLILVPGGGHLTLWQPDVMAQMKSWIAALPEDDKLSSPWMTKR